MIIQPNTNIIIRTEEEYQVFCEIGDKEGIQWWKGGWYKLSDRDSAEILRDWGAIYIDKDRKAMGANPDYIKNDETIIIEAAILFHNQLISRRLKQ